LSSKPGFPKFLDFLETPSHSYLIMQCLGPNLETLKSKAVGGTFSLKTVVNIGCQVLERLETLHNLGFLHRDIKPENFLIDQINHDTIYLIDFGLCTSFEQKPEETESGRRVIANKNYLAANDPNNDEDNNCSQIIINDPSPFLLGNKKLVGTMRYASVNCHLGLLQGRRDDLESLAYMLVYFYKGMLPWQNIYCKNMEEQESAILKKKEEGEGEICKGLPKQFENFLNYVKRLKLHDRPDYGHLKEILLEILKIKGEDLGFEWCKKK
jgi:casein kinase 1